MADYNNFIDIETRDLKEKYQYIFEKATVIKTFKKGEYAYIQGDLAEFFFYVKEGSVRIFFNSPEGMEKTITIASKGDVIGEGAFFDGKPRVSSAVALESTTLCCLGKDDLKSLIKSYPELAVEIMRIQAKRIRLLSEQLDNLVFLPADTRIARLFLQEIESKNSHKILLTHEEIGNHIGVSRITVSKILSKFAKDGIVTTNYRYIIIKDSDKLKQIAKAGH